MKKYICTFLFLLFSCSYIKGQVYENPVFDRTDVPMLHIDKIEITKTATVIHCTYSAVAGSWANISRNVYLQDEKTMKRYSLMKCDGFPYAPEKKTFLYDERYEVTFYFSPMKLQGKVDFIENPNDQAFNIYGVDLNNQYAKQYSEPDIKRFSNTASFYESSGDINKAIQNKEEEIKATQYVNGVKSEAYLVSLLSLAILHNKCEMYGDAIKEMETLTKLQAELWGTNNWQYALQLRTLAQFYGHACNYEKSVKYYKESVALFESLNILDKEYARALSFLSDDLYKMGNNDSSLYYEKKCISARRNLGDAVEYVNELSSLVKPGFNKQLVIERVKIAENELNNLPHFVDVNSFPIAALYKQIANTYNIIDDLENAIIYCDKALSIINQLGRDYIDEYASTLSLKCKVLNYMGNIDKSLSSGLIAKHVMDSLQIHTSKYADLLSDLASAYSKNYDFEKSIQLQSEACRIVEQTSGWLDVVGAYNSLGGYYKDAMDYDNAELYIMKAVDIISNHDDVDQYYEEEVKRTGISRSPSSYNSEKEKYYSFKSHLFSSYASLLCSKKEYTNAIIVEKERGKIINLLNDKEQYRSHLMGLSQYYFANGQYNESVDVGMESIKIARECNINPSPDLLLIAMAYIQMQDITMAINYANEALKNSVVYKYEEGKIQSQVTLAMLYYKSDNYIEAEKHLSSALDYLKNTLDMSGMTNAQRQRLWDKWEHCFYQYRKIVVKLEKKDLYLSKLYDYLIFSKRLLLDSDIYSEESKWNQNVSWKEIQAKLSNQDIAIEFFYTGAEDSCCLYHALVIDSKCDYPRMITLFHESDIVKRSEKTGRSFRNIAFDLIWLPILEDYKDVKNIFFSLDGLLHAFAIEYHNVYGYGDLLNKYNLYRLTSTKELIRPHNENAGKNAALFGGLEYNQWNSNSEASNSDSKLRGIAERGGFEPLFNTITEVNEVKKMLHRNNYNVTVYTGEDGTEDSFRKLSKKPLNIIHLSTHGMYVKDEEVIERKDINNFIFLEQLGNKNNPVKEDAVLTHSFLVLSGGNNYAICKEVNTDEDGILTAKEISQMDLRGVDLVVLSACDSGMGDLETGGVYGLQRGFKKAGANTILMSLNKVDDEATRLLMVEFYRNLMNGKSKYQSLKDAQQYLRQVDKGKYDKPEYWASFIMLDGLN